MRDRSGRKTGFPILLSLSLIGAAGCSGGDETKPEVSALDPKPEAPPSGNAKQGIVFLKQNWTPQESQTFYYTTQGSQVVPYGWFLNLEQTANTELFRDDANLLKFGYLLEGKSELNPDALPVGFVKDHDDRNNRDWLGFTCAACHTGQIDYKGVSYRVDGAPSLSDVREFLIGVTDALKATHDQEEKFLRFSKRVLGDKDSSEERATLKLQLAAVIEQRDGYNVRNFPNDAKSLPGRVDAFGAILNEVFHNIAKRTPGDAADLNTRAANAPVSFPFLWDTPQHDVVQWNGVAPNAGLGSLGRNVGEVLGVFGNVEIPEKPSRTGYSSTVKVRNLKAIESSLAKLWSPQWPADFPPIDPALRDEGWAVFKKASCNICHEDIKRADANRHVKAIMRAVGTEDLMFVNFEKWRGNTGKLNGAFKKVIGSDLLKSPKFGPVSVGEEVLAQVVIGTIIGSPFQAPEDDLTKIEYLRRKDEFPGKGPLIGNGGVYKARPLNGIWATAPYLHNGSVPTLYHLLLPGKDRPKSFTVGSREFDPKFVGFRTDAPGYPVFEARKENGKPEGGVVTGNSNEGHEFGLVPELTDKERWALVEYLKSL